VSAPHARFMRGTTRPVPPSVQSSTARHDFALRRATNPTAFSEKPHQRLDVEAIAGVLMPTEFKSGRGLNRELDEILQRNLEAVCQILSANDAGRPTQKRRQRMPPGERAEMTPKSSVNLKTPFTLEG